MSDKCSGPFSRIEDCPVHRPSQQTRPKSSWEVRAEAAESALAELRAATQSLVGKLDVIIPIVDGYIAFTHVRSGGHYSGPNLINELAVVKALLVESPAPQEPKA